MSDWNEPVPYMDEWLTRYLKRNSKHFISDFAYIRTMIKMFNESKLHICIPDEAKPGLVKLLATYVTTEEIIDKAIKLEKERK